MHENVEELIDTDKSKIKEKFLNKIYNLSEKYDNDILEKFSFNEETYKNETHEVKCRKLMTKINNTSEWENVYKFHLSLTTNDELLGQKLTKKFLDNYQKIASENLKKLKEEQLRRGNRNAR